jgi:hypothetical protein
MVAADFFKSLPAADCGQVKGSVMNPRICICCGEPMAEHGGALSRNPNVCASCSSLADGLEECGLAVLLASDPAAQQPVFASAQEAKRALAE